MSTWGALSQGGVAGAQNTAPTVDQCDAASISAPSAFPTGAAYEVNCIIAVVNNVTALGATSSTVTATACLAAAGVAYPSCPDNLVLVPALTVVTTTTSSQLVTSVNQCNSIVNGGGSDVHCSVTVTNNVPAATSTTNVTVNQCIGSATGGGSGAVNCTPVGSTTSATVTQCNGSATGGGTYVGGTAVNCTVTGTLAALPVTINQCNGTATGGGSSVTCSATVINSFAAATTTTTTTTIPATTTTTTTTTTVPVTTTTHHASTTTTTIVPVGAPATGQGGASGSGTPKGLIGFSALAVALAAGSIALRSRRQHGRASSGGHTRGS